MPPDGWWYIVAYVMQAGMSTIGAATWDRFVYFQLHPISGAEASSTVLGAELAHHAALTPGAVRAWWWNGVAWQRWPALDRDWTS